MPILTTDAFIGRRHAIERSCVCAMQGQFPVIAGGIAGELAAAFRAGAGHYGLSGTVATASSTDGGRTWSDPIEVAPRGDDVRNPALGIVGDRWIVAYWNAGVRCYPAGDDGVRRWKLHATRGPDEAFVVTSDDRGRTWTQPRAFRSELLAWASPFGRIVTLADGTLAMAAYGPPPDATTPAPFDCVMFRSRDGGASWGDETRVLAAASEMSLCPVSDTRLVAAVRRARGDTVIVRSDDAGRTWSEPIAATRVDEHPGDVCVLRHSGRMLLTFGRRRRPLGVGALVSDDHGTTWDRDHEVILAGDGIGNDVGYPSTVQLDDGTIVTACYFARGSAASEPIDGWGEISCQALRYPESLVVS